MNDPVSPENWRSRLERAKSGSENALGRLLEEARPFLAMMANHDLDSDLRVKESESDLVQQSLMEAARGISKFQGASEGEFRQWLKQILLNNVRDLKDRFVTEKRQIAREQALSPEDAGREPMAEHQETPSQAAVRREQLDALNLALTKLSAEQRQVIRLRNEEFKSFTEIGDILGVTEKAAQKQWARAVDELRQLLDSTGDAPTEH